APTMGLKGAVLVTVRSEALPSPLPRVDVIAGQRHVVLPEADMISGAAAVLPTPTTTTPPVAHDDAGTT
ncbi:MAG TPA: hypothetical protein VGF99_07980, partial [Myxococcota bacterium]